MSASRFVRSVWTSFIEAGGLEGRLLQNLKITDVEPGRVKFELEIEKYHTNRLGILHGGTIATMVDLGGSLAIASRGFHATGVSTDLNITYINSGGKVGQIIRAESICEKCGSENRWHTPASHSTTSPINWLLGEVTQNTSARHGRIHGTSLKGHPKLLYNIIKCLQYYYEDTKRSLHLEFGTSNGIEATFEMALTTPDGTAPNKLESLKIIIRDLLRTVREKFGVVAIEPQLTKDHFGDTIRKLPELCSSHNLQGLLECATKEILYDIAIEPLSDERFSSFCNLLDLALVLTELELTDVSLPFILIEELFDSQTIDSCQQLFEYLESRVERLTTDMEGTKGKGLVLLRLCNEVLRRLSKAEDTIFCGRILIFLSKSFILGERSGVNLRGEFNIENTTSFDQLLPAIKNEEKMDIDQEAASGQARVGTSEGTPIDGEIKSGSDDPTKAGKVVSFETPTIMEPKTDQVVLSTDSLYPVFWSLQNFFSNPTKLFVKESFEMFKAGLAATMAKFKAVDEEQSKQGAAARTADEAKGRGANSGVGEKRKREDLSSHFNPKYLTSRELFELELSDLTFRRHILVQALILIDFLLSLTPAARERWTDIPSPNKAVQYSFTLSPDDEKWATKTRLLISEYLQPNFEGRLFMRLVETILTRDKNWVQWKAENCVSFEKKPVPEDEVKQSMDRAMELCRPTRPYPHAMGAPALGRLWRDASKNPGMEGLKRKERHTLPTPESFRPLIKADEEEITDALRPDQAEAAATSKASKVWRALRIASRDRFHLFNKFVDTPDEDRNELEMLFDIEESEQEAKRIKLEESFNSGTSVNRDRLSTVPDTQQTQQQRTQSPSVGEKRAMSAPSTVPALSSDEAPGEARCREVPTEGSAAQTPVNGKIDSQPQQRIENIANLNSTNPNSHQPEMKLHRIESTVTS